MTAARGHGERRYGRSSAIQCVILLAEVMAQAASIGFHHSRRRVTRNGDSSHGFFGAALVHSISRVA